MHLYYLTFCNFMITGEIICNVMITGYFKNMSWYFYAFLLLNALFHLTAPSASGTPTAPASTIVTVAEVHTMPGEIICFWL